jgi:hypothetical protein
VIGWQTLVLGLLATWAIVVVPTLASLLMTEAPAGTATGWRNLGAVVGIAFVDIPYQVLTLGFRLQTMLRPRRKVAWGEMERSVPDAP